jgi:hypothetical protein
MSGQSVELIPQRLRVHHQTLSAHDPALPLQGEVIQVFRDRHLHRERRRIAAGRDQLARSWGRHHRPVAPTPILLALMAGHHELPLYNRDLVGLVVLPLDLFEVPTAGRAVATGFLQSMTHLDNRQLRLLAGTMPPLRLRLGWRFWQTRAWTLFRRIPE